MRRIFVGPNGIRSGWRVLIFLSIVMALGQGLRFLVIHVFHYQEPTGWVPSEFILEGSLFFLSALVAAGVMARIEKRTFWDYGLPLREAFGSLFWLGILWGFGTSAIEVLLIYLAGGLTFHGWAFHGSA